MVGRVFCLPASLRMDLWLTLLPLASLALVPLTFALSNVLGASGGSQTSTSLSKLIPRFKSHLDFPPSSTVLTYLEINGWLLSSSHTTLLVDPILVGDLDFGIPSVYRGRKRILPSSPGDAKRLIDSLPPLDGLLITQGLDDHAHVRTLRELRRRDPNLPIVAPPSARAAIEVGAGFGAQNVQYVKRGETARFVPRGSAAAGCGGLTVRATSGALVGPPWQRRENGYVVSGTRAGQSRGGGDPKTCPTVYIEPHVEFSPEELRSIASDVDIVITPVSGQELGVGFAPGFELVHGPGDTLKLLDVLRPKYVLPMRNGAIDAEGPLSSLVREVGSEKELERRLQSKNWGKAIKLVDVIPGKDVMVKLE